jgi:hypothetical protein
VYPFQRGFVDPETRKARFIGAKKPQTELNILMPTSNGFQIPFYAQDVGQLDL